MKYVDEFRDRELAEKLAAARSRRGEPDRDYHFMEFCGGHTHAIFRYGVQDLMPENVSSCTGPVARSASCRCAGSTTRWNWPSGTT
jgi:hydrogenase expression/formation protein HypD